MRIAVLFLLFMSLMPAGEIKRFNINLGMMEATCKIIGEGSIGTGFIIGKPTPDNPKQSYFVLVTADHVLEAAKGDFVTLVLRREKEPEVYERIEHKVAIRERGVQRWVKHPEVDVAAIFVRLPPGVLPLIPSLDLLLRDEDIRQYELTPGVELNCLGYPLGVEANPQGFPILRSGKIASFPLVPTARTKTFLFDFTIFKGNSGGPVYLFEMNPTYGGQTRLGAGIQGVVGLITAEHSLNEKTETLYERRHVTTPLVLGHVIHASFIRDLIQKMPNPKE